MQTNVPTLPNGKTGEEERPLIAKFKISKKDAAYRYHSWVDKQKNLFTKISTLLAI